MGRCLMDREKVEEYDDELLRSSIDSGVSIILSKY